MPVVPITSGRRGKPQSAASALRPPPDEPWALMAAAQMHSEGRLVQPNPTNEVPSGQTGNSLPAN